MGWIASYVYAHSRVQFHPAAFAILCSIFFVVLMTAMLFALSLILEAFGAEGVRFGFQTDAVVFGPVLVGELVRGHVKTWLRYPPQAWCFAAIGAAGLTAGGVFGATMALKWGQPLWLELLGWGVGMAAVYLLIGWLIRLDERQKSARRADRVTG